MTTIIFLSKGVDLFLFLFHALLKLLFSTSSFLINLGEKFLGLVVGMVKF